MDTEQIVKKWNENHAVGWYGGKAVIYDGADIRRLSEFKKLCNDYVTVSKKDEKKKEIREIDIWLKSHDRNYFDQIVFDPGLSCGYHDRTVNTYKGLAVQSRAGKTDPFLAHLEQNVCHNNKDWYDYLIQWMAHIVQHPEDKIGTAIVLKGDEGVGKSIIAEYFGRIFGPYYKRIDSSDRITGRFNSQFEKCLLCNADEAVCVYDKKGAGKLRGLVADKECSYEKKGYEEVKGRNFTNFFIISNDERVIAPGASDRRYFVLEVKSNWKGNRAVWNKIVSMMEGNGPAALLHYLQQVHITRDLRKIPKTIWHKEQEIMAEDSVKATWRQYVDKHEEDANPDNPNRWPLDLYKDTIYAYHQAYCKKIKDYHPKPDNTFFRMLRKLLPAWRDGRGLRGKGFIKLPARQKCLEML